jgi:ABC-type polysaccharide/polyol phosphate transport system ATPase subunit
MFFGRPAARTLRPGEIVLEDATRSFSIRADQARTLKDALIGRRASGPAPVHALNNVSLHIEPGETVGMVGRNGAGKTSTLRVLAGIIPLQSGSAACGGRVVSLLELAGGFSRDFSGRENIYLQAALYGFQREQVDERLERIIAFSELGEFIDVPVKTYSAGMFVRLGFSIATHLDADVMLIDEVLAVGDEAFQRKCLRRISEQIASGATLLLVSHDLAAIERVCERVVVMDGGKLVFDGPTTEGVLHYRRLTGTEHGAGASHRQAVPSEIQISDVELRDAGSRATSMFRAGSAMQVHIDVLAERPSTSVMIELRGTDGEIVFRGGTELELDPGARTALVYEIPDLTLLGGDYDLTVGAGPSIHEAAPQRTVHFSVVSDSDAVGLVDLRGTWRVRSAAEGVR